jgi:ABC-type phosphate transport system substrate-binding protein
MNLQRQNASILTLMLLFALAVVPKPAAASTLTSKLVLAQAAPLTFPAPGAVESGTIVKVDGSTSMALINQTLKQQFEQKFAGTQVQIAQNGGDASLKAVLEGRVDVAAIGRPLTSAEKAQGLVEIPVARNKLAIIVGEQNPFEGSLTLDQFAQIMRGEITDWSQVGGAPGPIRVIDRPNSDTRLVFGRYPFFPQGLQVMAGAITLEQDTPEAVLQALGANGISFATAPQVLNQAGVKTIPMYSVKPEDPRYPFSQTFYYVYKGPQPSPAVQAFLGFATTPESQQAIGQQVAGATGATVLPAAGAAGTTSPSPNTAPTTLPTPTDITTANNAPSPSRSETSPSREAQNWLFWLLPLGLLGLLLWWLTRGRSEEAELALEGVLALPASNDDAPNSRDANVGDNAGDNGDANIIDSGMIAPLAISAPTTQHPAGSLDPLSGDLGERRDDMTGAVQGAIELGSNLAADAAGEATEATVDADSGVTGAAADAGDGVDETAPGLFKTVTQAGEAALAGGIAIAGGLSSLSNQPEGSKPAVDSTADAAPEQLGFLSGLTDDLGQAVSGTVEGAAQTATGWVPGMTSAAADATDEMAQSMVQSASPQTEEGTDSATEPVPEGSSPASDAPESSA